MSVQIACIDYAPVTQGRQTMLIDVRNPGGAPLKLEVQCNDGFSTRIDVTDGVYTVEKTDNARSVKCFVRLLKCVREECNTLVERAVRYISNASDERDPSMPIDGNMVTYMASGDYDVVSHEWAFGVSESAALIVGFEADLIIMFVADRPPILASVCAGPRCTPVLHIGTGDLSDQFYCHGVFRVAGLCNMGTVYAGTVVSASVGVDRIMRIAEILNSRVLEFARRTGHDLGAFTLGSGSVVSFTTTFSHESSLGDVEIARDQIGDLDVYSASGYGMATFALSVVPSIKVHVFPYYNKIMFSAVIYRLHMYYLSFALNEEYMY